MYCFLIDFSVVLGEFWASATLICALLQCENMFFRILPNYVLVAFWMGFGVGHGHTIIKTPMEKRLKNQSKQESEVEAKNGAKLFPK